MEEQNNLSDPAAKTKEERWEHNDNKIRRAIATSIHDYAHNPSCSELAAMTQLSRQTIQKHLKKFSMHPLNREEMDQFRMLSAKVFAKVANLALHGDMDAIKLFFKVVNTLNIKPNEKKRDPYYYVYLNKTSMFQDRINRLTPEERDAIEAILKTVISPAEDENEEPADTAERELEETRNRNWENNHYAILTQTYFMMNENARMPSYTELAVATGLSRQTISQHFREFAWQPMHLAEIEQLKSLAPQLLTVVANEAMNGNIKASKLFFKLVEEICPAPDDNNPAQMNNYMLVNGIMIDQPLMDKIGYEKRQAIEDVFKNYLW